MTALQRSRSARLLAAAALLWLLAPVLIVTIAARAFPGSPPSSAQSAAVAREAPAPPPAREAPGRPPETRPAGRAAAGPLDAALRAFWEADSPKDAEQRVAQVLATRASVATILARLKAGRTFQTVKGGRVEMPTNDNGNRLDNVLEVPADYTAGRRWALRVSLHGGVGRPAPDAGGEPPRPLSNRIPGTGEIVLHPRAWAQSEWWTAGQVDNVLTLVDRVKRRFNIDESRIYATGISDGGTGVYYLGMRAATPWAACLPLNGHPSVLANPDVGADGQLYPGNLANCPTYAVNGGRDRLYPAASVAPLVEMFKRAGVPFVHQIYPDAGHDVSWWPEERARYEAFLAAHARAAHPPRVSWETERTDRYNRFRWLIIDRLGKAGSDVALEDVNSFAPRPQANVQLYDRSKPSGRVDAVRNGNTFDVRSRGVRQFTLLLSPDVIDLARPVKVTLNGRVVHDAVAAPDAATLLQWAARDNDRTMLYAAALSIAVP
jgi:poly(3-hydroxybutyrate) depolymerase